MLVSVRIPQWQNFSRSRPLGSNPAEAAKGSNHLRVHGARGRQQPAQWVFELQRLTVNLCALKLGRKRLACPQP